MFPYNSPEIVPAAQDFDEPLIIYNIAVVLLFPYNDVQIVPAAQDFPEPLILVIHELVVFADLEKALILLLKLVPIRAAEIVPDRLSFLKSTDYYTKACSYKYCSNVPAAYLS